MLEKIKHFLTGLKQNFSIKKIIVCFFVAAIILLPTFLAIYTVKNANKDDDSLSNRAQSVVLYDSQGKELYREHEDEGYTGDSSLISIFNTIYDSKQLIEKLPSGVVTEEELKVELIRQSSTDVLICHFSFVEGGSYCEDEHGKYYKIPTVDSERFLASQFAEILYPNSVPPTMTTIDGDIVPPKNSEWYYQNVSGLYLRAGREQEIEPNSTYHLTSALSVNFTSQPDSCTVEIYSDGERVFLGKPSELIYLILDSNSVLSVNVTARWTYQRERAFYGTVSYSFDVIIHSRADFFINKNEFYHGEFAILKATNIGELSKLNFQSELDFEPSFTLVGDVAYAMIPCPDSDIDKFDFSISYGVTSKEFSIKVTQSPHPTQRELSNAAYGLGIDSTNFGSTTERYCFLDGDLELPSQADFQPGLCYGDPFNYKNTDSSISI